MGKHASRALASWRVEMIGSGCLEVTFVFALKALTFEPVASRAESYNDDDDDGFASFGVSSRSEPRGSTGMSPWPLTKPRPR